MEKQTEKFLSQEVQNEILELMSDHIICNLLADIREKFYSLMTDEYTDKQHLTFGLCWINDNIKICEKLLGFYEILDITSKAILNNLVPSASFRYKRKAKKRPWNTSNT